jgi:hypothetical protein
MYTLVNRSDLTTKWPNSLGFGCSVSHSRNGRERMCNTWWEWVLVVGEGCDEGLWLRDRRRPGHLASASAGHPVAAREREPTRRLNDRRKG